MARGPRSVEELEWQERVALRIRQTRDTPGYSIPAFAKAVGTSISCVQAWESGERQPTAWSLVRIARVGRVSLDWLLALERKENG